MARSREFRRIRGAWLIRIGRNKAIDQIRREIGVSQQDPGPRNGERRADAEPAIEEDADDEVFGDDRLRLIFTCCHPALNQRGADRAHASRSMRPDDAGRRARLSRGRGDDGAAAGARQEEKFATREFRTRRRNPRCSMQRIEGVLAVVYGVFTEGYAATHGDRN